MKTKTFIALVFLIAVLSIAGCKAAEPQTGDVSLESSYPADKGYPLDEIVIPSGEVAYPITQQDLSLLFQPWTLSGYRVNDQDQTSPMKTLTFQMDGSVMIVTEAGTADGSWSADISMYPTLTLNMNDEGVLTYSIVALSDTGLALQLIQDGNVIDEQYLPAD